MWGVNGKLFVGAVAGFGYRPRLLNCQMVLHERIGRCLSGCGSDLINFWRRSRVGCVIHFFLFFLIHSFFCALVGAKLLYANNSSLVYKSVFFVLCGDMW